MAYCHHFWVRFRVNSQTELDLELEFNLTKKRWMPVFSRKLFFDFDKVLSYTYYYDCSKQIRPQR